MQFPSKAFRYWPPLRTRSIFVSKTECTSYLAVIIIGVIGTVILVAVLTMCLCKNLSFCPMNASKSACPTMQATQRYRPVDTLPSKPIVYEAGAQQPNRALNAVAAMLLFAAARWCLPCRQHSLLALQSSLFPSFPIPKALNDYCMPHSR
ncbi:hypothetical protein Tcan_13752 [Toxocara canis]|uniref:Uncharacterized protein n=1 Tax=Toxocara canis TaxID=6265 RepID=A0A0B2VXP7_TOXCA|nr:hypothetical protein Tcan_13752 [Toxocara canis]